MVQQTERKGRLWRQQRISVASSIVKRQGGEKLEINWNIHEDNAGNITAHAVLIFSQLVF